ncbi:Gelsolin, cytoplasmic [Papilio machaon]|uniref:Gelsolin, cytoplasmic n=1 Tax=Papilio machaon TaxID=76193 RepID=A0A0N1PJA8_PAPMA|nr:Gelsolin, cytoplasmic [Papilio machaon]
MDHPAFAEAGSGPGIEVWTIEQFEPVPIEKKMYGKFFNGDSYIVLKVPAEATSLTKDHCFILEVDHDIFVLMPEGAKATQRRKIISVANTLRDDDHNGRATIEIIDDFSSDEDIALFFEALGSGSKDDLVDAESNVQTYSREDMTSVYLYRVLIGEDELDLVSLSKPYKQMQLSSSERYILDTPCSGVYIWLGNDLDEELKKNYYDIAQKYLDMKEYPSWVHVTRVAEGNESCTFKQYFHNWETVGTTNSRMFLVDRRISNDEGSSSYPEMYILDTPCSGVYIWLGNNLDEELKKNYYDIAQKYLDMKEYPSWPQLEMRCLPLTDRGGIAQKENISPSYAPSPLSNLLYFPFITGEEEDITDQITEKPVLYDSDVYVVKYQYDDNGDDAYVIYVWIGTNADPSDKAMGMEMAAQIDKEEEANVNVVKVPHGKEPKHFLAIFKGNLAVLYGSKNEQYKAENSKKSYDDDGVRLFRVEGTELEVDMRTVQVPETAEVLEDDDVFVLETPEKIYVWHGKESQGIEHEAASNFVQKILGEDKETIVLEQGEETDEFWEFLGGAPEEKEDSSGWKLTLNRRVTTPLSLTAVTVSVTGKIDFEELPPEFTQQDLSDDGVYILDTGEELYFWKGKKIPERVRMAKDSIIEEYVSDDGLDRTVDSAVVVSVRQGKEPAVFKKLFPDWDDDMWENQTSYEDIKNETKAANSK